MFPAHSQPQRSYRPGSGTSTPPPGFSVAGLPNSVISLGSASRSAPGTIPALNPWCSEPILPLSTSPANGPASAHSSHVLYGQHSYHGGMQAAEAAAAAAAGQAALLPWFAVVVELLGDVVRLAIHEADMMFDLASSMDERRRRPEFDPTALMLDLEVADQALTWLGEALQQQAMQAAAQAVSSSTAGLQHATSGNVRQPLPSSASTGNLAEAGASAAAAAEAGAADGVVVDVAATMAAICSLLMYPPREIDTLFMRIVIERDHVLTGRSGG